MSDINVAASIDVGQNTQALIEKLAAQIGVTVDKVWPWLVRQQVVEGWSALAMIAAAVLLGACFLGVAYRLGKTRSDEVFMPFLLIGGTLFLGGLLVLLMGGSYLVRQILNPEYFALKDLVQMVKP